MIGFIKRTSIKDLTNKTSDGSKSSNSELTDCSAEDPLWGLKWCVMSKGSSSHNPIINSTNGMGRGFAVCCSCSHPGIERTFSTIAATEEADTLRRSFYMINEDLQWK